MRTLALLLLSVAVLALPAQAKTLTVFAAASTVQVLNEIRNDWNAEGTPRIRVIYGSSGALARQIENGAPANIYFSANSTWVDYLVEKRLAAAETRKTLFRNRIVLVAPAAAVLPQPFSLVTDTLPALGTNGRLAIGDPQHVPAGIYARQALSSLGLWSPLSHRTVATQNVRLALALVQRGEAPLGIVYYTDAIQADQVRITAIFDGSLHAPIDYQAIAIGQPDADTARFLAYLGADSTEAIFCKFGFLTR